jgi:hypothetical protein
MSELPRQGGSYLRQGDGTLKRAGDNAAPSAAEPPTAIPAAPKRGKEK